MTPSVLLATTTRWFPTARLAVSLAQAGFRVEAVCPWRHPIATTRIAKHIYPYRFWSPLDALGLALLRANPHLVIPGDDLALRQLYALYKRESRRYGAACQICQIIERSLGPAENFPVLFARTRFLERAQEIGARAPETSVLMSVEELQPWVERHGLPLVLKVDGTSGGEGVRIVRDLNEAKQEFRRLSAAPLVARALARSLRDGDTALLEPALRRKRPVVNVQSYVSGCEGTSAIACWNGRVLAALHFKVLKKAKSSGHATVVRLVDNAEMTLAAERIAGSLKLSGLHGLDYMIEPHTGHAHLIEINARSTQVGHLALGPGRDLSAALYAAISARPVRPTAAVTDNKTIALFPQEWIRDMQSPYLRSAYHDVPWECADLVRACVLSRRKQSAWYSRAARFTAAQREPHSNGLANQLTPELVASSKESTSEVIAQLSDVAVDQPASGD